MLSFDIPINIRVNAETEEQAEEFVTTFMDRLLDGSALTRPFITWDFVDFICDDEPENESNIL